MKKSVLFYLALLIVFVISTVSVKAQSNSQTYEVGTNVISGGLGLGSSIAGGYTYGSQTPGISLQFEHGFWEAGPGVISLGAYLGYKGYKYSFSDGTGYSVTEKWNYTIIGARGAYHFTGVNVENLDLYAGVMLSYDNLSFSYSNSQGGTYAGSSYGSSVELSPFAGAKYYFAGDLGGFAELGFGVSIFSIGLSYKF
jgi:hypothetical protein